MTLNLDLPRDLERQLVAEAESLQLPLHEYAMRLLASGRLVGGAFKSGAELVAYWQKEGVVGSRVDIVDSQMHARALGEDASHRKRG